MFGVVFRLKKVHVYQNINIPFQYFIGGSEFCVISCSRYLASTQWTSVWVSSVCSCFGENLSRGTQYRLSWNMAVITNHACCLLVSSVLLKNSLSLTFRLVQKDSSRKKFLSLQSCFNYSNCSSATNENTKLITFVPEMSSRLSNYWQFVIQTI